MKVYTLRIDREAMKRELEDIDGIQVRVPNNMDKADAEDMITTSVPNVTKYSYSIYCVEDEK